MPLISSSIWNGGESLMDGSWPNEGIVSHICFSLDTGYVARTPSSPGRRRGRRGRRARLRGKNLAYRIQGVGVLGTLVVPVALHPREPQCQAARITGADLQIAEGYFHHQLGPHVHRPLVAVRFAGEQFLRLPFEHGVRQTLEGLAQHDVFAL